jgi:restriction system protein
MSLRNDDAPAGSEPALPWWTSIIASGIAYWALTYLIPALAQASLVDESLVPLCKSAALPVSAALLIASPIVYFKRRFQRRRRASRTGLGAIRSLSWREFERLVAEAFRRQGFAVEARGAQTPDSGVDLTLRGDGSVTVVHCKHWREQRVGVRPVREVYGVMHAENATGALIITAGSFTAEAIAFALSKPIGLIEGPALLELLQSAQSAQGRTRQTAESAPVCHICSRPMVRRTTRKGFRKRETYWECAGYPHCKGTRLDQAA